MEGDRLSQALGWWGVGLGLTGLTFADGVCELLGARRHPGLVRALGARSLLTGVGLLSSRDRRPWWWARIAGDAVDLSLLGLTFRRRGRAPLWRMAATAVVLKTALVDVYAATRQRRARGAADLGVDTLAAPDAPHESWRGSGLAEDIGVPPHGEPPEPDERAREEQMRRAEEALGLPSPDAPGSHP